MRDEAYWIWVCLGCGEQIWETFDECSCKALGTKRQIAHATVEISERSTRSLLAEAAANKKKLVSI